MFVKSTRFKQVCQPLLSLIESIFIDMFAPKWARGPHYLARFPSWNPCITPGY